MMFGRVKLLHESDPSQRDIHTDVTEHCDTSPPTQCLRDKTIQRAVIEQTTRNGKFISTIWLRCIVSIEHSNHIFRRTSTEQIEIRF